MPDMAHVTQALSGPVCMRTLDSSERGSLRRHANEDMLAVHRRVSLQASYSFGHGSATLMSIVS